MEPEILILRDPRESAKKCSLTPLHGLAGVRFVEYDGERRVDAEGRICLHPEGEDLGPADAGRGMFLVDCAWRRLPKLMRVVDGAPVLRRLPRLVTAYPRRSRTFPDPEEGLASVEALFAALSILGRPRRDLLEGYHWAGEFLDSNPSLSR